jgi:lipoprotein-anchoring transpeptidase ErfK/SrfK
VIGAVLALLVPGSAVAASRPPAAVQQLVALDARVIARAAPDAQARAVAVVAAKTPLTGVQMTLPVLAATIGPKGGGWLRVRLPTRPNGGTGWIPASAGEQFTTGWAVVVDRGARRADVYRAGRLQARFPIVVGKPATPTPLGSFFVVEKLQLARGVTEGPWALPISGYSNVLQTYAGGRGEVGLHGTVGLDDPLGSASSHGCIRFAPRAISWIAGRIDPGTPVIVRR